MVKQRKQPGLNKQEALRIIRYAADNELVRYTHHAIIRMTERNVTPEQVLRCMKLGMITEGPSLQPNGNYKVTMRRFAAGQHLNIAVVIEMPSLTIVVTVYLD